MPRDRNLLIAYWLRACERSPTFQNGPHGYYDERDCRYVDDRVVYDRNLYVQTVIFRIFGVHDVREVVEIIHEARDYLRQHVQGDQPHEWMSQGARHVFRKRRQLTFDSANAAAAIELLGEIGTAGEAIVGFRCEALADRSFEHFASAGPSGAAGGAGRESLFG